MSAAAPDPVLVTGATGTVGRMLTAGLAAQGVLPRVMLRPGSESAPPEGGVPVRADADDPASLRAAFSGVRSLFLLTPLGRRQDLRHARLLEAAERAGVEWIVKVSALGADPASPVPVHREHGLSDAALAASGIPHAVLRPNAFMQNTAQWRATIERMGAIRLPMGRSRVSMVDARDVAAAACAALVAPGPGPVAVDLTGPEALSYDEIAAAVSGAAGVPVRYCDVSPEEAAEGMRANGMPDWAIESRLALYATIRAGEAEAVTDGVRMLTGRPPRRLADLLAETGYPL
ncbi:NAD(P)H-binding protein [Nocardiopsis sp. RSe5-2]|uniref:NAD(P)H-binding protein n=1 Tax=Nocardiopsis endophytica TaxID=3018445 RepID=A0ABT4U383_9ACTN|nr:NAD(P)H-binding protein [Nocardiopsis endophytica]MDA2811411.1 NAD(P)H-binding protein [Nocardiopsis endophytica]